MPDIEARLSALERENDRLRGTVARQTRTMRVLCTLLVVVLGGALTGASAARLASEGSKEFDTVTAKKLEIVKDGKVRIRLETGTNPEAKVVLLDDDGAETAGMYLWNDSVVFNATRYGGDKAATYIRAGKDNASFMATSGAGGGNNAPVVLSSVGNTQTLYLGDRKDGPRAKLTVSDDLPTLSLFDKRGAKALLGIDKDGRPIVRFQEDPIKPISTEAHKGLPLYEMKDGKLQPKKE